MAKRKGAIHKIEERSGAFALTFLFLFALTFGFLAFVGDTPDTSNDASINNAATGTPVTVSGQGEEPVRIIAKSINLDVAVVNPTTTDVNALDQELTKGAVRYPTSGLLGINGTVLLFGHSSYLPILYNLYYKTFDGIQNLKNGDIVSVYSATKEYQYSVTGVRVADANDAQSDVIELPQNGQYLTLITCDSFATKSNRFIVTATFVGAYALSSQD